MRHSGKLLAERFRTAAFVASVARFDDEKQLQTVLDCVAASIRDDVTFRGLFGAVEGPDAVVLARAHYPPSLLGRVAIGSRTPLADTLLPEMLAAGGPIAFDDLRASALLDARRVTRATGTRSAIGTAFRVGGKTYFLRFTTDRPTTKPFDEVDHAYIDLIAKLFAQRLRQDQHRARLRFVIEHDLLTELPNRAKLRAAVLESLEAQPGGALIKIDLDRFRDVVRTLGRQTADAVLVEVAAALRGLLLPVECLGRTGEDLFAVYLPGAGREAARERARQIIARFALPFGTGDRTGTEAVRVTASLGVALLPDDAGTVDELFARAEAAVDLAKASGRDQIAFYFRPGSSALAPQR